MFLQKRKLMTVEQFEFVLKYWMKFVLKTLSMNISIRKRMWVNISNWVFIIKFFTDTLRWWWALDMIYCLHICLINPSWDIRDPLSPGAMIFLTQSKARVHLRFLLRFSSFDRCMRTSGQLWLLWCKRGLICTSLTYPLVHIYQKKKIAHVNGP